MRKILAILFLAMLAALFFYFSKNFGKSEKIKAKKTGKNVLLREKPPNKTSIKSQSIFVPYWTIGTTFPTPGVGKYGRIIYFGVTPNLTGINKEEQGYGMIEKFISLSPVGKEKLLAIPMTNDKLNFFVLEHGEIQKKIVEETMEIVNQNGFDGVVLDLEIFNIFNDDTTKQINNFVQQFYSEAKKNYRKFALTLYGDTFFRYRPFDVEFLSNNSDEIMVMAYDFHKSRGEPGPNFPLSGKDIYGYDFQQMATDFLRYVPKEKLTVIFGMFGYDWTVDEKKRPIKQAKALSLNEIKNKFFAPTIEEKCSRQDCVIRRDELSKEIEINYIISSSARDEQGIYRIDYHIVWFEDEESVKDKTKYLQEKGIGNIAFWAYGYF